MLLVVLMMASLASNEFIVCKIHNQTMSLGVVVMHVSYQSEIRSLEVSRS